MGRGVDGLAKTVLRRALRKRCPQCGERTLFARYARLNASCVRCGLVFRREPGAQTGSMYLTAIVTQLLAAAMIGLAWVCTDWGVATFLGVSIPLMFAFCAVSLPFCQSLWVGVEYVTDANNGESWVRPRLGPRN